MGIDFKLTRLRGFFWILFSILQGCTPGIYSTDTDFFLQSREVLPDGAFEFRICHSYGCRKKADIIFSESDWDELRRLFVPAPATASGERQVIAAAVAGLEKRIGEKSGINSDRGGSFPGLFEAGQMDCEDEAVNTSVFLILLERQALIRFHRITGIAHRSFFITGWPHMAALITETKSGSRFVVDSWFSDQGDRIHVVSFEEWRQGWHPASDL